MVTGENGGPGIPETVFHPKDARKQDVGLATNLHLQMVESHALEIIYKLQASFSVLDMLSLHILNNLDWFRDIFTLMPLIYSLKGCVKDTLPAAMTANCKIQNSCAKLGTNKCSWKFKGALNAKCKRNLKSWHKWQNARVKTYCKQSCRNCARKFSVRTISFDKIACFIIFFWLFWTFIISYS